jgi:hypothetical protein
LGWFWPDFIFGLILAQFPFGPGLAHPNPKDLEKSFREIWDFPVYFLSISLNIGLYFYTVKIQILY